MGQYYMPTILDEWTMKPFKSFYSHDYDNGLKLMEHSYVGNNFVAVVESFLTTPQMVVWAGDYAPNEEGCEENIYSMAELYRHGKVYLDDGETYRYVINEDTKQFVDKESIKKDSYGYKIHPLPLLTCEGNGQGGGDFFGKDPKKLVGSWARNMIRVSNEKPDGYTELVFDLMED